MSSSAHKYLDYINQQVTIAPANSQEELQSAQMIANVFRAHDLDAQVEDFNASSVSPFARGVIQALLLVSVLLCGIGVTVLSIVFGLIAIACAALLVLDSLGKDLLTRWTPPARSQNVVACHRATGELTSKGNRPIVVVAHYDTPRENLLFTTPLARYQGIIRHIAFFCVPVAGFAALVNMFGAGSAFGRILWLIGLIACVPVAILGVAAIAERFAPCSIGANDNKAGLAALFDVLNTVRPVEDDLSNYVPTPEVPLEPEVAEPRFVMEEVIGVRHGKEVVEGLGMLPETCEVEYVDPKPIPVEQSAPEADSADETTDAPVDMAVAPEPDATANILVAVEPDATTEIPATVDDHQVVDEAAEEPPAEAEELSVEALDDVVVLSGDGDESGLDAIESADADATVPNLAVQQSAPETPDDPEWGRTNFRPAKANVARRASLFDLPDPRAEETDPLASEASAVQPVPAVKESRGIKLPTFRRASGPESVRLDGGATTAMSPVSKPGAPSVQRLASDPLVSADPNGARKDKKHRLFGRRKKREQDSMSDWLGVNDDFDARRDGDSIGSWDNFDSNDSEWKGGAAVGAQFRVIDGAAEGAEQPAGAPTEEDLREAILGMSDDKLISHDIWFVALGASELDHAGMDAFLADHRTSCRGAFVINLDCIGAGTLSLLAQEGVYNKRRADRRLCRLLTSTAQDLHIDLQKDDDCNMTTDVTSAMRHSMRSVTIMGLDEYGAPAYSHTGDDVPEQIDENQVSDVADLICETIRRS